jgi:hypothetical protein
VTYNVEFSLDAAAELLRIAGVTGSASAIRAADSIRRRLEVDPAGDGNFLSEGLYYIDEEPLRAFFLIDVESASVEITDFRILRLDNAKFSGPSVAKLRWNVELGDCFSIDGFRNSAPSYAHLIALTLDYLTAGLSHRIEDSRPRVNDDPASEPEQLKPACVPRELQLLHGEVECRRFGRCDDGVRNPSNQLLALFRGLPSVVASAPELGSSEEVVVARVDCTLEL